MLFSHWITIVSICVLGAMSPGPSLAVVMKNTLAGSRWHGMMTGIGHGIGVGIYASASVLGLAVILQHQPVLFQTLQLVGAAFLFWLGIQSFRSSPILNDEVVLQNQRSPRQAFYSGFLVAFLNPKIAVFFLALFSQFVDATSSVAVKMLYSTTAAVIDLAWYCLVAAVMGHKTTTLFLKRWMHRIEQILGVLLIGVAIRLVFNTLL